MVADSSGSSSPPDSGGGSSRTTSSSRPSQIVRSATKAVGWFILLRFLITHATILYLHFSRPMHLPPPTAAAASVRRADNATPVSPDGIEAAEPVVKTITKQVIEWRQMTVLSDDQLARIEREMAEFVVPLPAEVSDGEGDDTDGSGSSTSSSSSSTPKTLLDDEERSRIESYLRQISDLTETLNNDLLPQIKASRTRLRSDVYGIWGDIRGGKKRKALAYSREKVLERREHYETLLAGLRHVIVLDEKEEDDDAAGEMGPGGTSYRDWDDDKLKRTFEGLMAELEQLVVDAADGEEDDDNTIESVAEGGGRSSANQVIGTEAIVADLGTAIRAVLGDDTSTSTTTDDGEGSTRPKKAAAAVKVCDPAFLSREVPAGCLNEDGAASGGSDGGDCSAAAAAAEIDADDIARESDLFAFVGLIEEKLRDRTGRFSGLSASTDEEEEVSVCPLTDTSAQRRLITVVNRKVAEANAMVKREEAAVAATSAENEIETQPEDEEEEEDKICATDADVEYLLDEGIDAIHRKRDLREELLSALRLLYDDKGEEFDAEAINWNGLDAARKEQGPKSTPHLDWVHAADASFAHRGSFRTLIDTPSFHEAVDKVDALADAVGGYNDGIDRLVDYIAGDERDGGSVSKTVKTAILNVAGRIPIPPQYYQWKEKAGVLA